MDKVNFSYSMKNIFIPKKQEYLQQLIHQTGVLVNNLRWKAEMYLRPLPAGIKKEKYGFRSLENAKPVPEMQIFEEKLCDLTRKIEFREVSNTFQNQLNVDIRNIQNEPKLFVPADKTTNFYKVNTDTYEALVRKEINKEYVKAKSTSTNEIIKEAQNIARKLELDDRIFSTSKLEAFTTLKDHKPNFKNKPTTRLINPTKPELGKVSKQLLSEVIKVVREKSGVNQWKNTYELLNFFNNLPSKEKSYFIKFDICAFYPAISEELLSKSIEHAAKYVDISDDQKEILFHTSKSLLYHKDQAWVKKGRTLFDVGMGAYDGAEKCDLVGLYLIYLLRNLPITPGLYRDDGLAVSSLSPKETEKGKNQICQMFKLLISLMLNLI